MRLIDADKVKELINGLDSLPWEEEVDDLVDSIPTAYDVEKVVAELEEEDRKANQYRTDAIALHNEEFWRGRQTGLLKAIEIARNGGKE